MALSAGYQVSSGGNISPWSYDHGKWDLSDMCAVATSMETYPIFDLKVIENSIESGRVRLEKQLIAAGIYTKTLRYSQLRKRPALLNSKQTIEL